MRLRQVAVDQQHAAIFLERQAQREVDASEGLAVAGQRARDHDQFLRRTFGCLTAECGLEQRALDGAVLIGDLAFLIARRQQACGTHGVAIHFDESVGLVLRLALRRRRDDGQRCAGHDLADVEVGMSLARLAPRGFSSLNLLQSSFD